MLSFTIAHISIVALRLRHPEVDRPYRAPWNVSVRGKPVPLTAVLGAIGTGAAFVSVVALHTEARYVGTGWMIAGVAGYFLYRRRAGLDPKRVYRIPHPPRPVGFLEPTYSSVIVPIFGTSVDTQAMARAAAIAGPDAAVEALFMLQIPVEQKLDCDMTEEEAEARTVLEIARLQARTANLKVRVRLVRTRHPGKSIVDEAIERRADLIYISTEHASSAERDVLGPTTRYVLAKRPCKIIVEGGSQRPPSEVRGDEEPRPDPEPAGSGA
jgi:APA family basic amino acid/polyamine antiporter